MKDFLVAWFHGNLSRSHYVVLGVIVLVLVIAWFDAQSAEEAKREFIEQYR